MFWEPCTFLLLRIAWGWYNYLCWKLLSIWSTQWNFSTGQVSEPRVPFPEALHQCRRGPSGWGCRVKAAYPSQTHSSCLRQNTEMFGVDDTLNYLNRFVPPNELLLLRSVLPVLLLLLLKCQMQSLYWGHLGLSKSVSLSVKRMSEANGLFFSVIKFYNWCHNMQTLL